MSSLLDFILFFFLYGVDTALNIALCLSKKGPIYYVEVIRAVFGLFCGAYFQPCFWRRTPCRLFLYIMFSNWAQPTRLQRHRSTSRFGFWSVQCQKMPNVQMSPLRLDLSLFIRFWCGLPPFGPLSFYLWWWRAKKKNPKKTTPQGSCVPACATIVRFVIIIPCCHPAPYDVWECGRRGTESQPEPLFNDGLLQPEQRMLDSRERTGARSAPSLQHVHQKPALERLQSL